MQTPYTLSIAMYKIKRFNCEFHLCLDFIFEENIKECLQSHQLLHLTNTECKELCKMFFIMSSWGKTVKCRRKTNTGLETEYCPVRKTVRSLGKRKSGKDSLMTQLWSDITGRIYAFWSRFCACEAQTHTNTKDLYFLLII